MKPGLGRWFYLDSCEGDSEVQDKIHRYMSHLYERPTKLTTRLEAPENGRMAANGNINDIIPGNTYHKSDKYSSPEDLNNDMELKYGDSSMVTLNNNMELKYSDSSMVTLSNDMELKMVTLNNDGELKYGDSSMVTLNNDMELKMVTRNNDMELKYGDSSIVTLNNDMELKMVTLNNDMELKYVKFTKVQEAYNA